MGGADLSHGAVAAMSRTAEEGLRPALQVVSAQRRSAGTEERYSLLLSDGVHTQLGMLAPSLNHLVTGGDLCRGTVARILDYNCSGLQGQR
jgi:replication factor A1